MKLSIYVLAAAMLMAPTFCQNVDAKKKKKVNLKAITANKADADSAGLFENSKGRRCQRRTLQGHLQGKGRKTLLRIAGRCLQALLYPLQPHGVHQ